MFKKAERRKVKLKIAMTGPSGSGKTYSALQLAKGLGKRIAVIDTENDSASLYADRFDFDAGGIAPPYSIDKYLAAIDKAVALGYEVLIIDSLSHAWAGEGGVLEQKSNADARGGNQFANWRIPKEKQAKLRSRILASNIHVIATMRSKQEYALSDAEGKKGKVQKLGLAPIQEPGMEYEFTTVFDVDMEHRAFASKDRTGLFSDRLEMITPKIGEEFLQWLESASGAPIPQVEESPQATPEGEGAEVNFYKLPPLEMPRIRLGDYFHLVDGKTPLKSYEKKQLLDWYRKKVQDCETTPQSELSIRKLAHLQEYLVEKGWLGEKERFLK